MPLLIGCIQSGSMSVALLVMVVFRNVLSAVYLAMITTAGGCPITRTSLRR